MPQVFRSLMTASTVGEIASAFQDEGFALGPDCGYQDSSIRRQTTQEYLDAIDWSDPRHVRRARRIFGRLMHGHEAQYTEHVDEPDLRTECFRYAATTFARTGKPERARTYFDLAAETFRQSGNRIGEANVYRNMAHRLVMSPDERIRLARESVALAREAGDQPSLAVMLHGLAVVLQWTESFDEVLTALAECALIIADMRACLSRTTGAAPPVDRARRMRPPGRIG